MALPVPEGGDPVVAELGPGTGSVTAAIRQRLAGRGRHLAVELNPVMADLLARRFPDVEVVQADALTLPRVLADRGVDRADVVVSGLPWLLSPGEGTDAMLAGVLRSLRPDGAFVQFTYAFTRVSGTARRRVCYLRERFEEVVIGRTVWGNLPPAVVYFARRPRAGWSTVSR